MSSHSTETSFSHTDGKIKELHPKECVYVLGAKSSHPGPDFNLLSRVVFGHEKVPRIRSEQVLAVLTGNGKNCTQTVWVCFGCKS